MSDKAEQVDTMEKKLEAKWVSAFLQQVKKGKFEAAEARKGNPTRPGKARLSSELARAPRGHV